MKSLNFAFGSPLELPLIRVEPPLRRSVSRSAGKADVLAISDVQKVEEEVDLVSLLEKTAIFLWKDWPRDMQVTTSNSQLSQVTLRGKCPHCGEPSVFMLVTGLGASPNGHRLGGMQCQGCLDYILGVFATHGQGFAYINHYPLGKPDDKVAEEIPPNIQEDFKEALRCQFVQAWNATAEMCRRAIEASCIDLRVPVKKIKVLEDMIDWLEKERKITPDLKDAAHKVRLGGNRGAHPPEDGPVTKEGEETEPEVEETRPIEKIEKEHAEAIVDFTRHFFQYVYVIPKQLHKYDFSKPKKL